MIVQFLLTLGTNLVTWIGTLMPTASIPSDIASPNGWLTQVMAMGSGLGVWADWVFLGGCTVLVGGAWAIGMSTKMGRAAITHIPWFGGRG